MNDYTKRSYLVVSFPPDYFDSDLVWMKPIIVELYFEGKLLLKEAENALVSLRKR